LSATFIPKTSVKLRLGDFAMLQRDDGRFVPLVFLSPVPGKRAVFYGALLSCVCEAASIPKDTGSLALSEVAMIDIDVFSKFDAPVLGNLVEHLSLPEVESRLNEMKSRSLVWGYRTPLKYANAITA
jgi:hypothetical protein